MLSENSDLKYDTCEKGQIFFSKLNDKALISWLSRNQFYNLWLQELQKVVFGPINDIILFHQRAATNLSLESINFNVSTFWFPLMKDSLVNFSNAALDISCVQFLRVLLEKKVYYWTHPCCLCRSYFVSKRYHSPSDGWCSKLLECYYEKFE